MKRYTKFLLLPFLLILYFSNTANADEKTRKYSTFNGHYNFFVPPRNSPNPYLIKVESFVQKDINLTVSKSGRISGYCSLYHTNSYPFEIRVRLRGKLYGTITKRKNFSKSLVKLSGDGFFLKGYVTSQQQQNFSALKYLRAVGFFRGIYLDISAQQPGTTLFNFNKNTAEQDAAANP